MRTLLLQIHLYAGLLCSSYLVIFGISSLNYNHHFGEAISVDESHWERQLSLRAFEQDRDRAFAIRARMEMSDQFESALRGRIV